MVRGNYYPAKGTGCLWYMGTAWLNTGVQPLMSRLPRLPMDCWMSVKMLFWGSSPSVSRMVWYGGRQKICTCSILHTHTKNKTCTKARPNGGWAAVLLGSNRHPAVGICTCNLHVPMLMYHFGWLAAGTAAARLPVFKALDHEAVTEAYDLQIVYSHN
jgi:hypothetical protein